MAATPRVLTFDVSVERERHAHSGLGSKAERDCFVEDSVTAKPRYTWTVNGESIG